MIRFIDLRQAQIAGGRFAFFDTVTDTFITDDMGDQAWDTIGEFTDNHQSNEEVDRFVKLIPEWAEKVIDQDEETKTPYYQHDCDLCVYLDSIAIQHKNRFFDLYRCEQQSEIFYIAREGNDPNDYSCGMEESLLFSERTLINEDSFNLLIDAAFKHAKRPLPRRKKLDWPKGYQLKWMESPFPPKFHLSRKNVKNSVSRTKLATPKVSNG